MRKIAICMLVAFTISACVPIPPEPPRDPNPITKAGLVDLASVFAKWDDSHETDEYFDRLVELEKCIWKVMELEGQTDFTDQEVVAKVIYTVGILKMAAQVHRQESFRLKEITEYHEDFVEETGRYSYQYLGWAIEFCDSSDHE